MVFCFWFYTAESIAFIGVPHCRSNGEKGVELRR